MGLYFYQVSWHTANNHLHLLLLFRWRECGLVRLLALMLMPFWMTGLQGMEAAVAQHHAGVVVVDSIAALMRAEFGAKGQVVERQELLGSQASVLKHLAESFRLPVVVTNQVGSASVCLGPISAW